MDSYFTNLMDNGSYDNNEEDISQSPQSQVPFQFQAASSKDKQKKTRTKNFTTREDLLLISAWLNIGMDKVNGTNQTYQTYWDRIAVYFHKHKNFDSDRNSNSLMNRWSSINLAAGKFQGYYCQIEGRNQSGLTEQDKVCQALEMYKSLQKSPFSYMHCWNELRYAPKFLTMLKDKKNKTSEHSSPAASSPSTANLVDLNVVLDDEHELIRPTGRKAAKELFRQTKKNDAKDALMEEYLLEIKQAQAIARDERKEKMDELLRLEREKQERQARKEAREIEKEEREKVIYEERVLSMDTTNMDANQVEYFSSLKASIMEKRRTTGF